jgi:hypothetical protein
MAQDPVKAREQWLRYTYARDTGHIDFMAKALRCDDFVAGKQWDPQDKAALNQARRPALTINKVLITLASVLGEQVETRSEISFRPRSGAPTGNAEVLTKVFRFISDQNQLNWVRSEVFADGVVTSRGYYDVRLGRFDRNNAGEVVVTRLNSRNVLPDPDATDYDPETWNDVITTSWMTADDIGIYYNEEDAEILRGRGESSWGFGYDSIDSLQDRFGGNPTIIANLTTEMNAHARNIRVIDRQYRELTKRKFFVDPKTGNKRVIPDEWKRNQIAHVAEQSGLLVSEEVVKRIRWTTTADDFVLHDDWSPYNYFTVVPYFPFFRHGRTVGLVEGLLDPQELLNKTLSQELHVVNTMANSGWIVRSNVLQNMTMEELEQVGAKTGLVLEVNGTGAIKEQIEKIQPNAIPQGLDRISFKAEGFIKSISGRGDSVMGLDRADVSGKAIGEKKESSDATLRKALDNLDRTDWMLARAVLDCVQQFYTDPRVMNITHDDLTGAMTTVNINYPDPDSGEVLNDLSLGEYDIVVVSQAAKRTLEESQFEQALAMREAGISIPDRFLIENSNLVKKSEIVKAMDAEAASPENQVKRKAELLMHQLAVAEAKGKAAELETKATHNRAKSAESLASAALKAKEAGSGDNELEMERQQAEQKMKLEREAHDQKMQIMREEAALKAKLQREEAQLKMQQKRVEMVMQAKAKAAAIKTDPVAAAGGPRKDAPQGGQPGGAQVK